MPEGDSIHKVALALRPQLVGRPLRSFAIRDRGRIPSFEGRHVQRIEAIGKHLLVAIEPHWMLRVHLGMKGRWRSFERARCPRLSPQTASVVLETDERVVVCFRAMQAELTRADDPRLRQRIGRLGPDLLAPDVDLHAIRTRARAEASRPIAEVLLDQRVASGIGNVYKSEVLFLEGIHPEQPVDALDDQSLDALFQRARTLMQANLGPGLRTTTSVRNPGVRRATSTSRVWVYRRDGVPCFRCKAPIVRKLHGDMARSTYWCPRCQPL